MFLQLILSAPLAAAPSAPPVSFGLDVDAEVEIPSIYVSGQPFVVELTYRGGEKGVELESWRVGPGAFDLDGKPLVPRKSRDKIDLPGGSTLSLELNLTQYLDPEAAFELALNGNKDSKTRVAVFSAVKEKVDFMKAPVETLSPYVVLLKTNQGDMLVELFPELAPNHVRNFLDLASSEFYDGTQFHRVSPAFMIQGGCPNTRSGSRQSWGKGNGPRTLKAEFSDKKHVRGILSMARGSSPDSGSCQFFIMTARSPGLDNQHSVFGQLVSGSDTLETIANAKGVRSNDGTVKPTKPQLIEKAIVLRRSS